MNVKRTYNNIKKQSYCLQILYVQKIVIQCLAAVTFILAFSFNVRHFLLLLLARKLKQRLYFQIECKTLFTLHKFFYLSQFSWIFIEGLYLFIVVVGASLTDQLKFKHCTLIGWGKFGNCTLIGWGNCMFQSYRTSRLYKHSLSYFFQLNCIVVMHVWCMIICFFIFCRVAYSDYAGLYYS